MSEAECSKIDRWIAESKAMVGFMPPWTKQHGGLNQVRWGIADDAGLESAELCLSVNRTLSHQTIVCLHKGRLIYRLDVAPESECKDNWHTAWQQGLPAVVCGTHRHGWIENRSYVVANGFSALPVRSKLNGAVASLGEAVHWVAEDLGISIEPSQREILLPDAAML